MVPEVQDQGRIDAPGSVEAVIEVKTEDFLKWKPTVAPSEVMLKPKLIGLTGKARSGKDTVAKIIQTSNPGTVLISFAEPIRNALRGMIGLTDEHFHGSLKEVPLGWINKSPRQLMQTLGTQWGRELVDDQIWIKWAQQDIQKYLRLGVNVVVTDVRFENEATMIRAMGGTIWHIERDSAQAVNSHVSEAGVAFVEYKDCKLNNNSDLGTLAKSVGWLWDISQRISHE